MTERDAFRRFADSLNLTYSQWHDGKGYDFEALAQLEGADLQQAEDLLIARNLIDERDVHALDLIGSERAITELWKGMRSDNFGIRGAVILRLKRRGLLSPEQIEEALVDALRRATLTTGLTTILGLSNSNRSPAVRKAVLWAALEGPADARPHTAAFAHFMHGGSASMFDTAFGVLYDRFRNEDRGKRVAAFRELCGLMNLDADALLGEFGIDAKRPWWRFW